MSAAAWGKDSGMNRFHNTFLGYRIYRKKFLGTGAVVLLLSITVFFGMLVFFVNTWMADLRQQSHNRFMERERRLANIQTWALDYTNELYENARLMDDLKALITSPNHDRYLWERRRNSLENTAQISYLPADIKKIFLDNRSKITGVTLRSGSGLKVLWLENGDIRLSFDFKELEDTGMIPGFGDILIASYSIRDPQQMGQTIGVMDFWISSADIYEKNENIKAVWGLFGKNGEVLSGSDVSEKQGAWLHYASQQGMQSGWLSGMGNQKVFFIKLTSSQSCITYVVVKDALSAMADNGYVVIALAAAFIMIALGVLFSSYIGIQTDADFLSTIMAMLAAMESGKFEVMQKLEIPVRHKENEYGMIAVALKDVGMKLEGYIETEYILKLKEQETEMRALQHQINPHFLYNTLETLRSKALTQGDGNMADAIAMLGTLYRARMHKKDCISLKEEFDLLEMYLKIMALRFGDNFVYQVELDHEIADIPTVNFWLQPLAENFFTHGFDRESMYNLLIVNGHAQEGGARIEIIDNGTGVRPELLDETRRNMYEGNDDPEADIGLRNVYMRLKFFYREGFTMDVGNNAEGGFCISIFIPGKVEENVHISDCG